MVGAPLCTYPFPVLMTNSIVVIIWLSPTHMAIVQQICRTNAQASHAKTTVKTKQQQKQRCTANAQAKNAKHTGKTKATSSLQDKCFAAGRTLAVLLVVPTCFAFLAWALVVKMCFFCLLVFPAFLLHFWLGHWLCKFVVVFWFPTNFARLDRTLAVHFLLFVVSPRGPTHRRNLHTQG